MASATLDASIFWPASMAITPRSRRRSPHPSVCNCKEQTEVDASWSFENSAADQSEDLYARDSSSHHCCWTPGVDGRDSSAVDARSPTAMVRARISRIQIFALIGCRVFKGPTCVNLGLFLAVANGRMRAAAA